jgi:hypothetical protein
LWFAELATEGRFMAKTIDKEITNAIRNKREQLRNIRDEIEDLFAYLDVLEARARDRGKRRLAHTEVKRRNGVKRPKAA